jgi:very-short-patch-repair endonuclease
MLLSLDLMALPPHEREYRFAPPRRWRFDFAWPERKVAVEVDGGTWTGGRHTSGSGFAADLEKLNAAVTLGWRVLRYTTTMIREGNVLNDIETVLGQVEGP